MSMGIYIKNMKMPEEGEHRMTLYVCSDGQAYVDVESFPVDKFEAVPVPPHGRLIDADALIQSDRMVSKLMMFGGEYVYTQAEIDRAPTIIEAEEEQE